MYVDDPFRPLGQTRRLALLLAAALSLGATSCRAEDDPERPNLPADADLWVSGALHVHSRYSDGAGTLDEIASAAARAGLDFVVVTDHWSLDGLVEGEEGYHQGVLSLVGVEATTEFGHVLGLDLPAAPVRFSRRNGIEVLRQFDAMGGFAILAHPTADKEALRWTGWDLPGYIGLEVFNAYSAYRRAGVFDSMAYLLGVSEREGPAWDPELIGAWDRELAAGPFVGWAGSDAHGGIEVAGGRFLRWPSYESIFGMVRNHLRLAGPLTGEPARDRRLIYDALRQGSGYVAVGRSSGDRSFRFSVEADGVVWPMGSDVPLSANLGFTARAGIADPDARLVLLRDGMPLSEARGGSLIFESQQPGVYRVEARGGDGWMLSNPVTILSAPEIEARRGVRALPVPPVPEMGDSRPYPLEFNVEPTPGCRSLEVEPDTWGPGSLRVRFSLGVPPRGAPDTVNDPWARCALADRRSHDLEGEMGIRFETRGDAIYRVSLFLADRDPDDGAPQFWATSFLTGKDWREIVIPFSQLEGLSRPRRLLEQGSVSEISFFLDPSNTRPGTTGEIGVRGVELISTRDTSRP